MRDTLTDLPNIEQLHIDLDKAKHPKLFVLDIDNFREINIQYTDSVGNFILQEFAKALQEFAAMHKMSCYRIGADEFALLQNIPFDLDVMEKILSELCKFISNQHYSNDSFCLDINAHIGICLDHFHPLKKALAALELAKKQNQPFVTYSEFATNLLNETKENIYKTIQYALEEKKILPFFQPILDINHKVLYNEVLIRLEGKDGVQSPKFFLDISHERGVYETIVKSIAFAIKNIHHPKGINLSYHDFDDENLFLYLIETFKDSACVFELQNDTYLHHIANLEKINQIKANDIKICIDNVKSPKDLECFEPHQIDYVKVHGDIIRLLPLYDKEYATCKDILAYTKMLDAKSIATHINSQTCFQVAEELLFDYFQGFLFGKPTTVL